MPPPTDQLLAALRGAGGQILTLAVAGELTAPVPDCPEWDLATLLAHLGTLWFFHAAQLGRGSPRRRTRPPDPIRRPGPSW